MRLKNFCNEFSNSGEGTKSREVMPYC